ncbi:MAG: prepilin-type N-terminal cleavage/methylation domain-containing protein [Fimbriimonadaceae bacterium]
MKRAFTLIELLVVIAIIAILAAILFPVFAQAKLQAKKAADLSNNKQINLAVQMYQNDADDLYPLECGQDGTGFWTWQYRMLIPPTWSVAPPTDLHVMGAYGLSNNTVQPYTKNYGILLSPGASRDASPLNTTTFAPAPGQSPQKYTYNFNGLLQSFNTTAIQSPATVPVWTSGFGANAALGWGLEDPILFCPNNGGACSYQPASIVNGNAVCQNGNGSTGGQFGTGLTWWLFNNGQNWAYADGHAKFRRVGNTLAPAVSNPYVEPFVNYDVNGVPGGYLWTDGCFPFLYRPDYVPPNGFN